MAARLLVTAASALAHGFSSVVYADVTSPERGHVRTELGLEYDLLVVSAADAEKDDPLFQAGTAAFENRDTAEQAAALDAHADSIVAYVTKRFGVADGAGVHRGAGRRLQDRAARRRPVRVAGCSTTGARDGEAHEVRSGLFPDSEGYVRGTKTIVTYDLDLKSGSASLDAKHPSFSTQQSLLERYWEFFRLGAEHLLTGLDHILFLLALIAGSRRLREIVLAATTFTLAHSVTFILAALGLVPFRRRSSSRSSPSRSRSSPACICGGSGGADRRKDLETAGHGHLGLDAAGGRGSRSSSASASCTGSGSPRRSGSTRPSRGRCCRRCSSSTWASRPCSSRSSWSSSRCSLCCATAHRSRGSRRPGRSPRACARWAWCGSCSAFSASPSHWLIAQPSHPGCIGAWKLARGPYVSTKGKERR